MSSRSAKKHRFARHRRLVAFVVPGLIAHVIWWSYAASNPSTFDLFTAETADTPNWYMCITMAFGSMVAGATSEVREVLQLSSFCWLFASWCYAWTIPRRARRGRKRCC